VATLGLNDVKEFPIKGMFNSLAHPCLALPSKVEEKNA